MSDDKPAPDYIGECALHQNRERVTVNLYKDLSDEDRIALARMTTDAAQHDDRTRWSHPPEEL